VYATTFLLQIIQKNSAVPLERKEQGGTKHGKLIRAKTAFPLRIGGFPPKNHHKKCKKWWQNTVTKSIIFIAEICNLNYLNPFYRML